MKRIFLTILLLLFLLPNAFALIESSSLKVFAVTGESSAQDATLNIKIVPGTGKIFSSIDESFVGSSTQESFKNAVSVADSIIGENIKKNYDFTVDISSNAYSIDGPSAGGSMTLLLISMFQDKNLEDKVSMTGSITSDGFIGDVGGIYQKSKKAAEIGIKLFFIPSGNRSQVINEDGKIEQIDLIDYAYNNWGLKIIEVANINDVLDYAFKDINSIDINSIESEKIEEFISEKINSSKAIEPFKEITSQYISQTEEDLAIVKESLDTLNIKDTDILQNIFSTITYSEELLSSSKKYYENNYFYSAANSSFLAYVNIISVSEIINNPSVLSDSSIVFSLKLEELENKIALTENRSNNCSIESFEWCIGARQRVTWARDKFEAINASSLPLNNFTKIQDYAYAVAWTEIANKFIDVSITDKDIKFVESNYFKKMAQDNIILVENNLVLINPSLATRDDFKRRLDAAKRNYQRGWYVTSLYDSATALSVIKTQEERNENFNSNDFNKKYNDLYTILKSKSAMDNEYNVWSKIFFDHGIFYKKSYEHYKERDDLKARSEMEIGNSILNYSQYLYDVEKEVIGYYLNTDLNKIIMDITEGNEMVIKIDSDKKEESMPSSQNVYVYSKDSSDNNNSFFYILIAGLFLMIVTIVYEIERFKKKHSKEGIIRQIGYLDEKLLEGKISPFTYKEMKDKYLIELHNIKEKRVLKDSNKAHYSIDNSIELEKKIIDKQIEELLKRKKELSNSGKSDSIKGVSKIVSSIKSSKTKKKTKKVKKS
jgi:uncharacterized protein